MGRQLQPSSLPCSFYQLFPWRINKNIKLLQTQHAGGKKIFNKEGGRVCYELLLLICKFYFISHIGKEQKKTNKQKVNNHTHTHNEDEWWWQIFSPKCNLTVEIISNDYISTMAFGNSCVVRKTKLNSFVANRKLILFVLDDASGLRGVPASLLLSPFA